MQSRQKSPKRYNLMIVTSMIKGGVNKSHYFRQLIPGFSIVFRISKLTKESDFKIFSKIRI